jgi:hypothetical protein
MGPTTQAPPVTLRPNWNALVWAINHDGAGKPLAFDDGFRACLNALGVSDRDIAVLFGEACDGKRDNQDA